MMKTALTLSRINLTFKLEHKSESKLNNIKLFIVLFCYIILCFTLLLFLFIFLYCLVVKSIILLLLLSFISHQIIEAINNQ